MRRAEREDGVKQDADETSVNNAVRCLLDNCSPSDSRLGWLMIASIFIKAWNLYSIALALVHLQTFHPSPFLLGLAVAGISGSKAHRCENIPDRVRTRFGAKVEKGRAKDRANGFILLLSKLKGSPWPSHVTQCRP